MCVCVCAIHNNFKHFIIIKKYLNISVENYTYARAT